MNFRFIIFQLAQAKIYKQLDQAGFVQGSFEELVIRLINYALGISGLVAVIYLILGGFSYITAGGNDDQTKKATKTLLNAIIGLIVIFSAYAIVVTVKQNILGLGNTPTS